MAKPGRQAALRRLRNYLIAGVLVTAPISITLWLIWHAVALVDDVVAPIIPPQWSPQTYLPFGIPGLGLVFALILITVIGFLAAGYLGRQVTRLGERLVDRVPLLRSVYSWTKQVFETILSRSSAAFREVVLIEYPREGCWSIGFITGTTEGEVQRLTTDRVYNVFVPATPNPATGFLLFVPEGSVHHLDLTIEEGLKLVISGGIVVPRHASGAEAVRRTKAASLAALEDSDLVVDQSSRSEATRVRPRRHALHTAHRSLIARLRNYFLTGLLVVAPISLSIWLAWAVVGFIDGQIMPYVPARWNPETYLPFSLPGLGVVVVVLGLITVGFFAKGLIGRSLVAGGERLLAQMPVIRNLYAAVKQIVETVLRPDSGAFREVVLFEYPRTRCWTLGFITSAAADCIRDVAPGDKVSVFMPTTPNPTSGFLFFLPRAATESLAMTAEEGIKMIVSGGIVTPPDPRSLTTRSLPRRGQAGEPREDR